MMEDCSANPGHPHVWRAGKWDNELTCSQCGLEMSEQRANDLQQFQHKVNKILHEAQYNGTPEAVEVLSNTCKSWKETAQVYEEVLKKIARVNAMDYEYAARAKGALDSCK